MAYADYDYYKNTYKGAMPLDNFERLSERATDYINAVTFDRISDRDSPTEAVKKACCAIADTILRTENGVIESEGNSTYNISFAVSKSAEGQLYSVAKMHLGNTGLLYRGGLW